MILRLFLALSLVVAHAGEGDKTKPAEPAQAQVTTAPTFLSQVNDAVLMAVIKTGMAGAIVAISGTWAEAGIRAVRRGGGYAEMQALTILNRLDRMLTPCLMGRPTCSERMRKFLKNLSDLGELRTVDGRLTFSSETPGMIYDLHDSRHITLPTAILYTSDGRPRSPSEIGVVVAMAWLMRPGISDLRTEIDIEDIGTSLLQTFSGSRVFEEYGDWGNIRAHALTLKYDASSEVILALEYDKSSVDITEAVSAKLTREGAPKATFRKIEGLHEEGGALVFRAIWSSMAGFSEGRVVVRHAANDSFEVSTTSVRDVDCQRVAIGF